MTTNTIESSQRTAARVAGVSLLFSIGIVVFANYVLLNPRIVRTLVRFAGDYLRMSPELVASVYRITNAKSPD